MELDLLYFLKKVKNKNLNEHKQEQEVYILKTKVSALDAYD